MVRSEAQKAADKRYAEKIKSKKKYRMFAVNMPADEYEKAIMAIKAAGMSKANFLRWAITQLENG